MRLLPNDASALGSQAAHHDNHDYHNRYYHPAGADLRDTVRILAAALKISNAPGTD